VSRRGCSDDREVSAALWERRVPLKLCFPRSAAFTSALRLTLHHGHTPRQPLMRRAIPPMLRRRHLAPRRRIRMNAMLMPPSGLRLRPQSVSLRSALRHRLVGIDRRWMIPTRPLYSLPCPFRLLAPARVERRSRSCAPPSPPPDPPLSPAPPDARPVSGPAR
jgi:hypothetical protein